MSFKRRLLPRSRPLVLSLSPGKRSSTSICPFCSLTPATRPRTPTRHRRAIPIRRHESTTAVPTNPRLELEQILIELKNEVPRLVNLPRLQLALHGLQQAPGKEAVRIAILGLQIGNKPEDTAKRLLRAILADPLSDKELWEDELNGLDPERPLIIRLQSREQTRVSLEISRDGALQELYVPSAAFNGLHAELLLVDVESSFIKVHSPSAKVLQEEILVPNVIISTPDHHISALPTPVHKALLIGDGFKGASSLSNLPDLLKGDVISAAVNMPGLSTEKLGTDFHVVDVTLAEKAISAIRQGPQHAREYERMWTMSNLAPLAKWLREGLEGTDVGTKPTVRKLIASILENTMFTIEDEQGREVPAALTSQKPLRSTALNENLAQWAKSAHTELQCQLDLAFTSHKWKKLGWWKLFWRVDDVTMLTTEMLNQRFLPTAEQELIYLAGCISAAERRLQYRQPHYSEFIQVTEPVDVSLGSKEAAPLVGTAPQPKGLPKWPGHISFTRGYLQNETIPALQALAQNLVFQALGTSGVATSISALLWVSQTLSSVYEAGVFAAVGIVYSLARVQKKWEKARGFWEGDVREEGRKAVRGVEESIAEVLEDDVTRVVVAAKPDGELARARELVAKAQDALTRMK